MTKEEFFSSIVKTLSVRAVNIIEELKITPDNIGSFRTNDFMRVPNCGKKTVKELISLSQRMAQLFPSEDTPVDNSLNEDQVSFEKELLSFNLSCRARNALKGLDIHDFASLHKEACNNFLALRSLENVGKKSIVEIQDFYDYLSLTLPQVEKIQKESTPEHQAYKERQSPYLDDILSGIFKEKYANLIAKDQKIISTYCANFVELLSANAATLNITASTEDKRDITRETIFTFRDRFLFDARPYLEMSRDDLWWQMYFSDKKFLSLEDRTFVRQFKEQEGYLPFWYIINSALNYHPAKSHKWFAYQIFASYIGLTGVEKSYLELSHDFLLTRERVRQILNGFKNSGYIEELSFNREELLRVYPFLANDFLTIENTNFDELSSKEHLPFDFHVFSHICSLMNNQLEPLSFYTNKKGKIITRDSRCERLYTCAYNEELSAFDFTLLMQKIQDSLDEYAGDFIVISEFCQDATLWSGEVDPDLITRIVPFIEHLSSVLFQVECGDGLICVEEDLEDEDSDAANTTKQILYDCLAESDEPLSLVELFNAYRKKCPETTFSKPRQLRGAIYNSDQIVSIGGKSAYTLKNRIAPQAFQGSLYDCIETVLRDSATPLKREDVYAAALKLRPDSNPNSIRSIISSMLKSERLKLYNNEFLGLPDKKYDRSFKLTQQESHFTFEDRIQQLRDFVAANSRLPFTNGDPKETSLALWYNRTPQNPSLTTQQMVDFYNFQQEVASAMIPLSAEHYTFQQNCIEYKAIVMRTGQLPRYTENKRLVEWLRRACNRYSEITDVRKYYFDDLIFFLSAFGFELDLQ